jgi:hypothetical protein
MWADIKWAIIKLTSVYIAGWYLIFAPLRLIGSRGQQNVIKIGKKNSDTVLWIKNYNKNAIGFVLVCF